MDKGEDNGDEGKKLMLQNEWKIAGIILDENWVNAFWPVL
jgi:hypothetical protein